MLDYNMKMRKCLAHNVKNTNNAQKYKVSTNENIE